MNVFIVVVCMNIAIVNAKYAIIDIDKILNIIQRRYDDSASSRETNEPVETLPIMPGFYMVKPDGVSNTMFKYPRGKVQTVYSSKKNEDVSQKVSKVVTPDSISKDLILKIFKDVFHGDPNSRDRYRYDTTRNKDNKTKELVPITVFKNKDLQGKIMSTFKNTHDSQGNYKYATIENQGDIQEDIPHIEFKNKDVLSRVMMDAVKNLHKNRASEKFGTAAKNVDMPKEHIPKSEIKNKDVLAKIMNAVKNIHQNRASDQRPPMILIKTKPTSEMKSAVTSKIQDILNNIDMEELENDASEIMDDDDDDDDEDEDSPNYRRKGKKRTKDRSAAYTSERESDASSSASGVEKNPGNPFTIHKNKYRQNWLWNHYMDGDHMNINPLGPQFANLGPSGPELFFGRKWWYFNQDDYKPMG